MVNIQDGIKVFGLEFSKKKSDLLQNYLVDQSVGSIWEPNYALNDSFVCNAYKVKAFLSLPNIYILNDNLLTLRVISYYNSEKAKKTRQSMALLKSEKKYRFRRKIDHLL